MEKLIAVLLVLATLSLPFTACSTAEGNSDAKPSGEETTAAETTVTETTEETTEDSSAESSEESVDTIYKPTSKEDAVMIIPEEFDYDEIDAFFDDSVFIGYSIMMHFGRYVNDWRETVDEKIMGTAEFRAGVGMNFRANKNQDPADENTTLPKHNNVAYHFEDLPKAMGVKTLVIGLMPYSDMVLGGPDTCVERGSECEIEGLKKIKSQNPNLQIIVLSGTYNTGVQKEGSIKLDRMHNDNVRSFNNNILEYCNTAGIDFIDVSTPLTNGYGYFIKEWASDGVYHIKQEPYKIWIEVLRDYARQKKAGTWQNPTLMPSLGFEID